MKSIIDLINTLYFIVNHPLNKSRKYEAIASFIKWQIGTRILRNEVLFPWVDDCVFTVKRGEVGLTGNIYNGLMEYEDMSFLLHTIQDTDLFIDVGANAGAYTLLASKVRNASTIAFEPIQAAYSKLITQIKYNDISTKVTTRNIGIGDKEGTLQFTYQNDTTNRVYFGNDSQTSTSIVVSTIDNEIQFEQKKIFIKIDVEGYEYNVLMGAERLLSQSDVTAIIIETNGNCTQYGHTLDEIHTTLTLKGFFPVRYDPLSRKVERLNTFNSNGCNTIYIKNKDFIDMRCKSSPKFKIHTAGSTCL